MSDSAPLPTEHRRAVEGGLSALLAALHSAKLQFGFVSVGCGEQLKVLLVHWVSGT